MAAIEVRGLRKTFRAKQKDPGLLGSVRALVRPRFQDIVAVRDVSFEVDAGETVAFIGPNGAGKSTTIKILTGILHPTSGEARVLGLVPWKDRERLAFRIGAVFGQKSQLWYHLPAGDTFALLARVYELDEREFRARRDELVRRFGIDEFIATPVRKLSLGQRMRAEIAAALLHRPQVLFLDEPTVGLDVVAKQTIRDLVREINREEGVTVFLTSHDAGDIEQICRRVMIIDRGQVIFDDKVSTLRRRFLGTKVVELRVAEAIDTFEVAGATVLKLTRYGVKLEVDTRSTPIDRVVGEILARYRVVDITINDPTMEAIIADVYRGTRRDGEAPSGAAEAGAAGEVEVASDVRAGA